MGTPFGRYELLRKVAAGGMAEIFLARQRGEGSFFRDVVIKRLFRNLAEAEKPLRMFQDEAKLLAELNHPNIAQVFELGREQGTWYIAMEWVDGQNTADLWRAGAKAAIPMPLPVALGIVYQLCEALHHAHEKRDKAGRALRIVHRDVTPQNLMVTRDGVCKLLDFGVAQTSARRDTDAGTVKGTYGYMAPEQVRGRALDKRADVFALGVVLWELTTGTRLYRGTDLQIMSQVVEHDAPPPSSKVEGYPDELEAIVMGCLQRDRGQRTPSASHLALAIEEFALRWGMLIGPRAVARYFQQVFPYEAMKDEASALVSTQSEAPPPAAPPVASLLEDASVYDDLDLLSEAPDFAEDAHDPLTLPAHDSLPAFESPLRALPPDQVWDDGDDEPEPLVARREPSQPETIPPDMLSLDDEDDAGERPVVLLASPKRPTRPPPAATEGDYMRELLKRIEEDSE